LTRKATSGIRGQLVEYAYPGLITLDPSRLYWTLRDSAGNVLWALEVYNPATGVSTGDLHAACTFESYCYNVEQDDAIFTCRTASGEAVYTLSASRRTKAKGNNLTQTQPKDFHGPPASYTPPTPDANAPAPNFLEDLEPYLSPEYWGTYLYIPQAQARIYCFADPLNYPPPTRDVTKMAWRRRLSADITTLEGHGVRYGLRCTDAEDLYWDLWWGEPPVTPCWRWSIGPPPLITEDDVGICDDGEGGTAWSPVLDGGPYWSLLSFSPLTLTAQEYAAPIPVQYALQNTPPNGGNDGQVTATSDMFLYTVHFHHPEPGVKTPPRKAGDPSVNVGCCLMPRNVPAAWIHHIELTLWDPAYPYPWHKRIISGPSGQAWISTMWDGKLYENGVSGTPYYTQASDFFMKAIVYWRPAYPVPGCTEGGQHTHTTACWKPWENGTYESLDEFQEPRYAIVAEDYYWGPVSGDPYNFAWITPGDTTPLMPLLSGYIVTNGTAALPATASWNLTITFPRPDPTRENNDVSRYPQSGGVTVGGSESWAVDFGGDIRGGEGVFACAFGAKSLTHRVHIRGLNPYDYAAVAYINNNDGVHWYAQRVARYESHVYVTPDNPAYVEASGGADYNQFYPWRYQGQTLPSDNPLTKRYGAPVYDPAYGWGIMQLTKPSLNTRATAQQVWDWHANVLGGIARLDTCRLCAGENPETHDNCQLCAIGWVNRQRIQAGGEPVPEGIYGNFLFGDEWYHEDPVDACTIQAYKGASLWVLYWFVDEENEIAEWRWRSNAYLSAVLQ